MIQHDETTLALMALAMVGTFMTLIMTGRLSALIALILVPIAFALLGGFGPDLAPMMVQGLTAIAPTGVMLIFAILYFGVMIDVGLFDPLARQIVRIVDHDPVRIAIGTAVLALLISLDGDGSTTYMITTAALIPLYRKMRMDLRVMACVLVMASAVMNLLPWGGPTARVMSALHLDTSAVFLPLVPAMAATAGWVLFASWRLGRAERARLSRMPAVPPSDEPAVLGAIDTDDDSAASSSRASRLFWFNFCLTLALMAALMLNLLPLPILFMVAFAIALMVNYPAVADQRESIASHAGNALSVGGMIFAAGIFTGILSETGMADALSRSVTRIIPEPLGPYLAPLTALASAPFTYFISNDAFYFGVVPILAETGNHYGLSAAEIGRASLVGQQIHLLSPLVPSTYLLAGLTGTEFADLVRTTFKWAMGAFLVFFAATLLTGAFPFAA